MRGLNLFFCFVFLLVKSQVSQGRSCMVTSVRYSFKSCKMVVFIMRPEIKGTFVVRMLPRKT